MEHACDKCGAPVEEGTAFCPHCNRPLIRVDFLPEATPIPAPPQVHTGLQWSRAFAPVFVAGLISSFLMLFPLGAFGLGMILGGILSVVFLPLVEFWSRPHPRHGCPFRRDKRRNRIRDVPFLRCPFGHRAGRRTATAPGIDPGHRTIGQPCHRPASPARHGVLPHSPRLCHFHDRRPWHSRS